jgi:hypothetical protein
MAHSNQSFFRALLAIGFSPCQARKPKARKVDILFKEEDGRTTLYGGEIYDIIIRKNVSYIRIKFRDGDVQDYDVAEFEKMAEAGEVRPLP